MNFSFVHDFAIDTKGYWEIYWEDAYLQDLYQQLKMRSHKVLEVKDEGAVLRRTQKLEPNFAVPSWASSVIKDTGYTEYDVYYRERSLIEIRIEPTLMKDRFQMHGTYSVTPLGEGRCRREFKGEVRISVPLLGGKIEKLMIEQLKESYDVAARVTEGWIQKKKAAT
jgi:hypothetical protein